MSMLEGFANAPRVPELRRRLLFGAVALAVYRLGVAIPTPGIDTAALKSYFDQARGLLGLVGVFTGGALERFSIFSLGIMPGMPGAAGTVVDFVRHGEWGILRAVAMAVLMVAVVAAIIYMERAQRR